MFDTVYAITSDLCALPIVLCSARSLEQLRLQLEMYCEAGVFTDAEWATVTYAYDHAAAPSDGLLGTAVSDVFTLPNAGGLRVHLQLVP